MQGVELLVNITVALVMAFVGGLIARRIGLPSIVGYMLAGIAIGPFTPGFVGDTAAIGQLAELGVIFLMFGVGLHFSLGDLWKVRTVAVPGALGRMALATAMGLGLSQLWGWALPAGVVLGLAISIASTVVLLRGLMDNGLLNTPPGQAAVGWVVMEDLATALILGYLYIRSLLNPRSMKNNLYLSVQSPAADGFFATLNELLLQHVEAADLRRLDRSTAGFQATYLISCPSEKVLISLMDDLGTQLPACEFSFVEQDNTLGG